jgi:hypothetical protein
MHEITAEPKTWTERNVVVRSWRREFRRVYSRRNEGSKNILYEMPEVIPYRMPNRNSGVSYGITARQFRMLIKKILMVME